MNYLHLGDCYEVLLEAGLPKHEYFPDGFVDLVYIDPPFNSNQDYNIFFDDKKIRTQHVAFEDTWTLKNIASSLSELNTLQTEHIYNLLQMYGSVAPHAYPYLVVMALRIRELHRVLKSSGSFYLHCDPTMSHYLKTICDLIFGHTNFRSEIIWRRTNAHNKLTTQYGPIHDVILFYSKSDDFKFHPGTTPYSKDYIESRFVYNDNDGRGQYQTNYLTGPGVRNGESGQAWRDFDPTPAGRHWAIPASLRQFLPNNGAGMRTMQMLEHLFKNDLIVFPKKAGGQPMYKQYVGPGVLYQDIWAYQPNTHGVLHGTDDCIDQDVKYLENEDELMDYPTQKPLGILERIISTSSDPGDIVLDAFCGCGTTVTAAEKLKRQWIGIDISPTAMGVIRWRLKDVFKGLLSKIEVRGIPTDAESAVELWNQNPNAFQDWWIVEYGALSPTFGTKGSDGGRDGIAMYDLGPKNGGTIRVAFQVKGGGVGSKDMDALLGTMRKFDCKMGIFLSIEPPTKPMLATVAAQGDVKIGPFKFPVLQTLTNAQFWNGQTITLPPNNVTFSRAKFIEKKVKAKQLILQA